MKRINAPFFLGLLACVIVSGFARSAEQNGAVPNVAGTKPPPPPKFMAKETLVRTYFGGPARGNSPFVEDIGKFTISASVPVSSDVLSALNSSSTFNVTFGGLNNNNTPISFSKTTYTNGGNSLKYENGVNALSKSQITFYSLDWSSKDTLKIGIKGGYGREIIPDLTPIFGVSLQAADYIEASTENITILDTPCVITFGTLNTTLNIGSTVSVVTAAAPLAKGGLIYTPSKVSIGSTIPKSSSENRGQYPAK